MRYRVMYVVAFVICIPVILVGCEEEKTEVERLTDRVIHLESELSAAQRHNGRVNQEIGSLKSKNRELSEETSLYLSQVNTARDNLARAEDLKNESIRNQESAAQFLQQRDDLHRQIENLRSRVVELNSLRQQVGIQEEVFGESIAEYESLVNELNDEITDLNEQVVEMSVLALDADQLQEELDSANEKVKSLAVEHPQFFISLLEQHKELKDSDLFTWESISLELVSSRFTLGQVLRMKMPLEMADNRGFAVLKFGSIEVDAIGCEIDLVQRIASYTFPNAAEVRSVMEINTSDIVHVYFGPLEFRSEIVFEAGASITGLSGTRINFLPKSIQLSDLPIANRSENGIWTLVE